MEFGLKLRRTGRFDLGRLRTVALLMAVWSVLLGAAGPHTVETDGVAEAALPALRAPPSTEPLLPPDVLPVEEQVAAEVLDVVEPPLPTLRARMEAIVAAQPHGTPLVVNEAVLARVRTLTGSATARRNMRSLLDRADRYAHVVQRALDAAGLPRALAALPILESGYLSAADGGSRHGLWMFEGPTARAYGLRISAEVDERLDPTKETAAAVRLLSDLRARFVEWPLVLASYNQGSGSVNAAMSRGGTQDAWALIARGELKDYAARAIAAAFVLTEPALVEG